MRILFWAAPLLAAAGVLSGGNFLFSQQRSDQAASAVQEALLAEAHGDIAARAGYVQDAAAHGGPSQTAFWLQGKVSSGGKWKSYDDLIADQAGSELLKKYDEQRSKNATSSVAQEALAKWCEQNNLPAQARAHWHGVLQFDPNHETARRELGFVNDSGKWVMQQQLDDQAALQKRIDKALDFERPGLTKLQKAVQSRRTSVEEAAALLSQREDIAQIPAWEKYVSGESVNGSLAVIAALSQMTAPEASHSLVRHALYHPQAKVRQAAIEALRTRDEQSYLPPLLAGLRGPWQGEAISNYDPVDNKVVTRFTARSETQDATDMQVLDDIQHLSSAGSAFARTTSQASRSELEQQRREANDAIEAQNRRITNVLQEVTGQKNLTKPQEWWQWWERYSESRATTKQTEAKYSTRNSSLNDDPAPFVYTSSQVILPQPIRHECLAAGTLILTDRGPVAVDKVRVGDMALARHATSGETTFKPVLRTTTRPPENLLQIELGGEKIRASGGHPFWVSGKGWLRARELKPEMYVHGLAEPALITAVAEERGREQSFNLIVEDFHSYFVQTGNVRILSHDNTLRDPIRTTVPGLHQPRVTK